MRFIAATTYVPSFSPMEKELVSALESLGFKGYNLEPSTKQTVPCYRLDTKALSISVVFSLWDDDFVTVTRSRHPEDDTDFSLLVKVESPMMIQLIHSICHNLQYPEF